VGNILGTSSFSNTGLFQPETPFSYSKQVIYKLGFPNMGNNGFSLTWGPTTPPDYTTQSANQSGGNSLQELDLNVKNTMIRHGNYDYLNKTIAWDPAITDYNIPNSYFRASKPAFFGNLAWPPFDPASPPGAFNNANLSRIPAGYRYVYGVDPPAAAVADRNGKMTKLASGYDLIAGPAPFTTVLYVTYRIPRASMVDVSISDLNGHLVKKLMSGPQTAGVYCTEWNGQDSKTWPSGAYCITMRADGYIKTIRVLLTK
jgi:hypothetical protein